MVLALTLFIIIVKELELDEFQIVVVQVFLHYSFMIYDKVTPWMSKMNDIHHIWLISLTEILTEEEDSREIFAVNIELCIFWLFFVLTNNTNKLVKVVIWLFYIWGNKTISRSLTLSLAVFLPWGLCICVSCDVLDVHNVLAYWLIVIGSLKSEAALFQTLSHLFHLVQFIKCWQFSLELNSKRLYRCSGKEKESRCLVFTSFHKTWN